MSSTDVERDLPQPAAEVDPDYPIDPVPRHARKSLISV